MTTDATGAGGAAAAGAAGRGTAGAALVRRLGGDFPVDSAFGQDTVDVPPEAWLTALRGARELGFTFFDWLTAVDQLDLDEAPGLDVVVHLWCLERREHQIARGGEVGPQGCAE